MKKLLRKKGLILLVSFVVISIVFASVAIVAGKYFHRDHEVGLVTAKEFFFYADYAEGQRYIVTKGSDGGVTVPYHLYGAVGSKANTENVSFQVSVTCNGSSVLTQSGSMAPTGYSGALQLSGVTAGEVYLVTVSSVAPYVKTFSFELQIADPAPRLLYSVTDQGVYVECTLYVGAEIPSEGVRIVYDSLIPDNTNDLLATFTTEAGNGVIPASSLSANAEYVLIFLKNDLAQTYQQIDPVAVVNNTVTLTQN